MQVRFQQQLYDDYKAASIKHRLEMSDIGNRAIRKFRSSGQDVASLSDLEVATKKTQPITIRLKSEIDKESFFKILQWYLKINKNTKAPSKIVIDQKEIEALDKNKRADVLTDNRVKILRGIENY